MRLQAPAGVRGSPETTTAPRGGGRLPGGVRRASRTAQPGSWPVATGREGSLTHSLQDPG